MPFTTTSFRLLGISFFCSCASRRAVEQVGPHEDQSSAVVDLLCIAAPNHMNAAVTELLRARGAPPWLSSFTLPHPTFSTSPANDAAMFGSFSYMSRPLPTTPTS